MQLISFDFETTSADPNLAWVIQYGENGGTSDVSRVIWCNPQAPMKREVAEAIDLTDDEIAIVRQSQPFVEAVLPTIQSLPSRCDGIVGWNCGTNLEQGYDCLVLARECKRAGVELGWPADFPIIDVMPLVAHYLGDQLPNLKLSTVAERLRLEVPGSMHRADVDAYLTRCILAWLIGYSALPRDPGWLHRRSADLYPLRWWLRYDGTTWHINCGKYKGQTLSEVEPRYLEWVLSLPDLTPQIRNIIASHMER